jgi:transcriptional regulator with XRE-family HTH domain
MKGGSNNLGKLLKTRRLMMGHTLSELAALSDVSVSHIARIERGERFPSAAILKRISKPLGFSEVELFTIAGLLPPVSPTTAQNGTLDTTGNLDAYVASILASEPVSRQRAIIGIFNIIKAISDEPVVQSDDPVRNSN